MCGIAGYVGQRQAESLLLVALERLKYRGYDSAGMAINDDGDLHVRKAAGRLRQLEEILGARSLAGTTGIAHTRWATHGPPTEDNAHPHSDTAERLAVVHNGIIENHEDLRRELADRGAVFASQTDTEVIAHLVAELYIDTGDPLAAVRAAIRRLEGSYAFAIIFADHPGRIIVAREGSPLLLGRGRGEHLIASDVPALLPHAHEVCQLQDGWIADVRAERVDICDGDGTPVEGCFARIEVAIDDVSRGDFASFMEKEIAEQPEVLQRLLDSRLVDGRLVTPEIAVDLARINHVVFLACGTSWHAALLGKRFLEGLARIHVEVDISSEYRYRNPVASGDTLVVAISQSGETADTLAGVRLARSKFMPVASLVNVVGSTMARESDGVLPLLAGPEIGVASTKAYTAQVLALYLFALQLAQAKGRLDQATRTRLIDACCALPELTARTLDNCREAVEEATELFSAANASVFLGRCGEYPTALEGALKLKEIAYVHATGYAAGEFKHGPIALVTDALPVISLCPRDQMFEKMLSNVEETRARDGRIITVGPDDERRLHDLSDVVFPVPAANEEMLQPLVSILPLQLYALLVAQRRGCDVDQPRNLAKSVTVE